VQQEQRKQEQSIPPYQQVREQEDRAHYNVEDMAIRVVVRKRPISRLELARYTYVYLYL
jgi:hypothetical protein